MIKQMTQQRTQQKQRTVRDPFRITGLIFREPPTRTTPELFPPVFPPTYIPKPKPSRVKELFEKPKKKLMFKPDYFASIEAVAFDIKGIMPSKKELRMGIGIRPMLKV